MLSSGAIRRYRAEKDYARKVPPGEIEVLFLFEAKAQDLEVGATIVTVEHEDL